MKNAIPLLVLLCIAASPAMAQGAPNLNGAIDIHVHQAPDSVKRAIDADDLARLAKSMGMRGLVMKNHWEPTASLAFMVRKAVPGIEIFGGITQDLAVGGINLEAVKHMATTTGGYGRVVWLPTFDNDTPDKRAKTLPRVPVSENGKLLPSVIEVINWIGQHPPLMLETGHVNPEEGLMVIAAAKAAGVQHIVVTHAMDMGWTVSQMQEAARQGAWLEFVYHSTLPQGPRQDAKLDAYAAAIRSVGAAHCILATDLGDVPPGTHYPLEPQGFLAFMQAMAARGIPVADIDTMAKVNPATVLSLPN
jgi:hypothetical protein